MKTTLCTTLKSLVSWMPYNSQLVGGMAIPSHQWFIKKYGRRKNLQYSIAINGICNIIMN